MGTSQSAELPKMGYHVLQVQPSSPGEKAGLVAFFDFIVAAQGIPMNREDSPFVDILKTNIGKEVKLIVYSTKSEATRETTLIPSDNWGGAGLAGISIRFCPFEHATEQVWHVLDVYPDSPASSAGLEARTDYIVGTPELLLSDSEDFFTLVGSNEGKSIPLYVYSTNTDNIRLIHIIPNSRWGGTGSLGCDIGYGYLHRIPMNRNIPQTSSAVPGRPTPHLAPVQDPSSFPQYTQFPIPQYSQSLPIQPGSPRMNQTLLPPSAFSQPLPFTQSPIMQPFVPTSPTQTQMAHVLEEQSTAHVPTIPSSPVQSPSNLTVRAPSINE